MAETFKWCVDLRGVSATHKFHIRKVQFGDGYEQRQPQSLRPKMQVWAVQKTGTKALIEEIKAFFDARRGVQAFYWQPPGRPPLLVKVAEYRESPNGGGIWQLSWEFEEVSA